MPEMPTIGGPVSPSIARCRAVFMCEGTSARTLRWGAKRFSVFLGDGAPVLWGANRFSVFMGDGAPISKLFCVGNRFWEANLLSAVFGLSLVRSGGRLAADFGREDAAEPGRDDAAELGRERCSRDLELCVMIAKVGGTALRLRSTP